MSSYSSPPVDSRKGLQKPESKEDLADISSVRHLLRLIERTRGTTEEVITEREKEIERQISLKDILLAKADLQEVERMRTGGHVQVLTQRYQHQYTGLSSYLSFSDNSLLGNRFCCDISIQEYFLD